MPGADSLEGDPEHGWATTDPWLPWPPEPDVRHVDAQRADPDSILHLYRRLLSLRRSSAALQLGAFRWLEAPDDLLAWERTDPAGDDRRVVAVNFGAASTAVDLGPELLVEVASDGVGEDAPFTGALAPNQAVVLRPAASAG